MASTVSEKLSSVLPLRPIAGAIARGLDNALFTRESMPAARMLYRRRRLIEVCADLDRGP